MAGFVSTSNDAVPCPAKTFVFYDIGFGWHFLLSDIWFWVQFDLGWNLILGDIWFLLTLYLGDICVWMTLEFGRHLGDI